MQLLGLLSDVILIGATLGLAAWCRRLSGRLAAADEAPRSDASEYEQRISELHDQVARLEARVAASTAGAADGAARVEAANGLADDRIGRMEMLLSSLEALEEESADRLIGNAGSPTDAEQAPSFRASRAAASGARY